MKRLFFLKKNLWNESLAAINSNELSLKMFKDRFTISWSYIDHFEHFGSVLIVKTKKYHPVSFNSKQTIKTTYIIHTCKCSSVIALYPDCLSRCRYIFFSIKCNWGPSGTRVIFLLLLYSICRKQMLCCFFVLFFFLLCDVNNQDLVLQKHHGTDVTWTPLRVSRRGGVWIRGVFLEAGDYSAK